jgi:hypothetical protein
METLPLPFSRNCDRPEMLFTPPGLQLKSLYDESRL